MPSILLVRLSKGRIQGADEVAEGLVIHTLHTALLGAGEHPRMLINIPE
jgi:hypothetical protein